MHCCWVKNDRNWRLRRCLGSVTGLSNDPLKQKIVDIPKICSRGVFTTAFLSCKLPTQTWVANQTSCFMRRAIRQGMFSDQNLLYRKIIDGFVKGANFISDISKPNVLIFLTLKYNTNLIRHIILEHISL